MSDDLSRAGERVRRQIEALGEIRNAGPRDQRFKVWRQETLTLLQRLWPSDHVKAERFRRIPFSAPMARGGDRGALREYFERGCKEATNYLEGLALELGCAYGGNPDMSHDDEGAVMDDATVAEDVTPPASEVEPVAPAPAPVPPPPSAAPIRKTSVKPVASENATLPISFLGRPAAADAEAPREHEPMNMRMRPEPEPTPSDADEGPRGHEEAPHSHVPPPISAPPPAAGPMTVHGDLAGESKPGKRKMRLKDMLGFGEDAGAAASAPPPAARASAPETPPPHAAPARPAAPPAVPPAPVAPRASAPAPAPPAPREAPADDVDPRRDLAAEFVLESAVLQSKAQPVRRPERREEASDDSPHSVFEVVPEPEPMDEVDDQPVTARPAAQPLHPMPAVASIQPELPTSLAAEEIYAIAMQVAELGVAPAQCSIVRATLIDLGRQFEAPPIHWTALRETVAFAMEHPELARRLMPLLLPYFDQAA